MITLSEAFVISTQFRETLGTIRETWYFKSFENLQSTLNEVPGIVFFDVKGRTMDEGEREGKVASTSRRSCTSRFLCIVYSASRRTASR